MPSLVPADALGRLRRGVAEIDSSETRLETAGSLRLGLPAVDGALDGGLACGALHELEPARRGQGGAAFGFALALAALAAADGRSVLLIQTDFGVLEAGAPYGLGLDLSRPAAGAAPAAARRAPARYAVGVRGGAQVAEPRRHDRRTAARRRDCRPDGDAPALARGPGGRRTRLAAAAAAFAGRECGGRPAGRSPAHRARPMPSAASVAPRSTFRFARTGAAVAAVAAWGGTMMTETLSRRSAQQPFQRRYLSVWLRRLATDRIRRRASALAEAPLVVVAGRQERVAALGDERRGRASSASKSACRSPTPAPAIRGSRLPRPMRMPIAALLEAVADWCDRYTPLVGLDPPDGLMLDITGCAHLFGGEAALGARHRAAARRAGLPRPRRGRRHRRLRLGGGAVCAP